jgi:hypothetical protein
MTSRLDTLLGKFGLEDRWKHLLSSEQYLACDFSNTDAVMTKEQKKALVELITALRRQFPNAKVCGHRDLANRLCPCFDAKEEYKHL